MHGEWTADEFSRECERERRKGDVEHPECSGEGSYDWCTPGVTGLCLLAFLGSGHTLDDGKYSDVVQRAVGYLRAIQDPDGCYGARDGHYMYNHAIATLAMAEAFRASRKGDMARRHPQRGIDLHDEGVRPETDVYLRLTAFVNFE